MTFKTLALRAAASAALVATLALGCSDKPARPGPDKSAAASGSAAPGGGAELKELDTSALTPNERKDLYAELNSTLAPCPNVPVRLYQCVAEKRDCKSCLPGAEFLLRQVRAGHGASDRE